ncbi:MAG: B12-binding domain-containing radical SAM protein [Deltaproteobacteria bacterium]|nr:B12-binding domain-containing radical SAM protein [Deltaproteobacteria bacterium]
MNTTCLLISPGIHCLDHPERFTTTYDFPRGLLSVGTFVNKNGVKTNIIPLDYYIKPSQSQSPSYDKQSIESQIYSVINDAVKESNPAFIGIGVPYTMLYPTALKIAEICKKVKPDCVIALGGPHVSYRDKVCFEDSEYVDIVIRGEGEWTVLDVIKTILQKKEFDNVSGITFKHSSGKVIKNQQRPLGDIKEIPMPDYSLLPEGFVKNMAVSIVGSRGCAYKCTYCNESLFWGQKVRQFPVEMLFEEIKTLAEKYGNYAVGLEDSMFNMRSKYFFELCDKLGTIKLHPAFYILSRVDSVTDDGFAAMKKAGVNNLILGIENGSQKVLDKMNKKITLPQAIDVCKNAVKNGLIVDTFWIIGHPGDNPEEAEITIDAVARFYREGLHQNSEIAMFVPYPGTRIFEHPEEFGLEILTYDWEKWARFNSEPVCQLKDFSREDIMGYWIAANKIANEWKRHNAYKKMEVGI